MTDREGNTLCFTMPKAGHGRAKVEFIEKEGVPEFEGSSALFEVVKKRLDGSPWPQWVVLRKVEN